MGEVDSKVRGYRQGTCAASISICNGVPFKHPRLTSACAVKVGDTQSNRSLWLHIAPHCFTNIPKPTPTAGTTTAQSIEIEFQNERKAYRVVVLDSLFHFIHLDCLLEYILCSYGWLRMWYGASELTGCQVVVVGAYILYSVSLQQNAKKDYSR